MSKNRGKQEKNRCHLPKEFPLRKKISTPETQKNSKNVVHKNHRHITMTIAGDLQKKMAANGNL